MFPEKIKRDLSLRKLYTQVQLVKVPVCCALFQEIDYNKEAINAELFAKNFKDLPYVKVPKIYWEVSTPQVSFPDS